MPTGGDVLAIAHADLYRLHKPEANVPTEAELQEWLAEQGWGDLGYSDILGMIAPDPEARRAYLAKHFEGVEPGAAHDLLAAIAADGLVRVFVTTNFDRLLEAALAKRGITPTVVTSADDLRRATQREHADVYIVKAHGDYLQQTIRNTAEELAALEPEMDAELSEIFNRYGVVALGYSGSDEAIGRLLRSRDSRYGVYWVTRGDPTGTTREIIEKCSARVARRDSAAEFLTDLTRRIAAFVAHPSGSTPDMIAGETIRLLRTGDNVGLQELLKAEWRTYTERLDELVEERKAETSVEETVSFEGAFMPSIERILAVLLPLVEYQPEVFELQVERVAAEAVRAYRHDAATPWPELGQWAAWWLVQVCGAFAVCYGRFNVVPKLVTPRVAQWTRESALATMFVCELGQSLGAQVMRQRSDTNWCAPYWEHLITRSRESVFLNDRYPELVSPDDHFAAFNFLADYIALRHGEDGVIAYWAMGHSGADTLAQRLARDSTLRSRVGQALVGLDGDTFMNELVAVYEDAMNPASRRVSVPGRCFWSSNALDILKERRR